MPDTIKGKSGRHYKVVDPDERCPECHKTARELVCKTVMAFAIHKASHERKNARPVPVAALIAPKKRKYTKRADKWNEAPVAPAPNGQVNGTLTGDVETAFKTAMGDVTKAMVLLQFATLLPRVSVGRAQKLIIELSRGVK